MQLKYQGIVPHISADVFIAPDAVVIGDVTIDRQSSIWFGCVVRGDVNYIRIGKATNIQDRVVVHVSSKDHPTHIGNRVTVGHSAIIHACDVNDECLVGIGAILLDGVVVGEGSLIAAGSLLPPGKHYPPGSFILGSPARVLRTVSTNERDEIRRSAGHYTSLASKYL